MSLLDRFKKTKKKETIPAQKKEAVSDVKESKEKEKIIKKADRKIRKSKRPKAPKERIISAYNIIKEPHITEKASYLGEQNKYVFNVYPKANKNEVKKAIEALYGVKAVKVNMVHSAPKKRRIGRSEGWRGGLKKGFKKAIVTLKEGEKIEIIG